MTRMRAAVFTFILAVPLPAAGQQPSLAADFDAVFAAWDSTTSPGCAVGVSRDGHEVLTRAYGMADLEHGIRNTPATLFEAGSVSKQFTAAAVLMLVQDGVLRLDDDVRRWVPELPEYGDTIRIRHLLNHTSGLRDWGSVAAIAGWGRTTRTHTHAHVLDILARQRALNFPPGTEYSYSNSGYNVLAMIVERASGVSLEEFSRRRLFEPLGLANTHWRQDYTRIVKGRAAAYGRRRGEWVIDRPIEHVYGNAGLLTTVGDLLEWTNALAEQRVGAPGFNELMHQRGVLANGRTIDYAAGLMVTTYNGVPEVGHTGSTSGYRAFLARYPEQRIAIAVLCNTGNVAPGQVGREIARLMLGDRATAATVTSATTPTREPARPPTYTRAQLEQLAGDYYSEEAETTFTIAVDAEGLRLERRPDTRIPLIVVDRDLFAAGTLGRIRFLRDEDGRVTQLSVQQARVYDLRFHRRP